MSFHQIGIRSSLMILLAGCSSSQLGIIMPEFTLMDTNPNSPTFEEEILPRDYLGAVTGWYFGHGD